MSIVFLIHLITNCSMEHQNNYLDLLKVIERVKKTKKFHLLRFSGINSVINNFPDFNGKTGSVY